MSASDKEQRTQQQQQQPSFPEHHTDPTQAQPHGYPQTNANCYYKYNYLSFWGAVNLFFYENNPNKKS